MTSGIIICHGDLAHALLRATIKIFGPVENVHTFSNDKLSTKSLYLSVEELFQDSDLSEAVMMVDLRGGSCWSVARMINRDQRSIPLLTGVNLPMLISFVTKRDTVPFGELATALEADANRGIVLE